MFLFVFYFQGAQGDSPIDAGIKLMPLALGMLVASPLAGIYADRHGSRALAAIGMLVTPPASPAMTTLQVHSAYWQSAPVAGDGRSRLGDVQQPQHRRDDGRRPGQAPRHRRRRADAAAEHRGGAVDRLRARDRHLLDSESDAVRGLLRARQGPLPEKLAPFIANMHVALWALSATSCWERSCACCARPRHRRERRRLRARGDRRELMRAGHERSAHARRPPAPAPERARYRSSCASATSPLVGTTPRTIRYYEEFGLLPRRPRAPAGGHRLYCDEEVERLREVIRLKELLGVSLTSSKTLLTAEEARAAVRAQLRRDDVDPDRRRELLAEALGHIDRQLELVATARASGKARAS